jgi:uncharacterized protein (TIGR04255 family)
VCDIRVQPRDDLRVDDLNAVVEQFRAEYPITLQQFETSAQFPAVANAEPQAQAKVVSTIVGVRAQSADNLRVYSVHLNGFSVSRLRPYANWTDLKTEGQRIWSAYREHARPRLIRRLALRYLNRIDVPEVGLVKLQDYLRTYPEVSPDITAPLSNFFFQLHVPQSDLGGMSVINVGVLPPAGAGIVSLLLDIDVFMAGDDLCSGEAEIWGALDRIRDVKNDLFEACITTKAREMFS